METTILGNTGLEITRIGLGAQTVGGLGYGDQDFSVSGATVEAYLAGGGTLIDTARGYGTSEIYVGKALKRSGIPQDRVVVCSKSGKLHPPCTRADLETSRFCLQRDYIDVYYVHVPPKEKNVLDKILDAYVQFRQEKLIRFIGLSCRKLADSEEIDEVYSWMEDERVDVIQFPFNPLMPEVGALIAAAKRKGIGTVARGTVAAGILDDRILPGHRFTDFDNDWRAQVEPEAMEEILVRVQEISERLVTHPCTHLSQLSQKWVLAQPGVDAVIGGAGTPEEVSSLLQVGKLPDMAPELGEELVRLVAPIRELAARRVAVDDPAQRAER